MVMFNKTKANLLKSYLKGTHNLKDYDAEVMVRLLQDKLTFTAKEILSISRELDIKNYNREAYNIISRLEQSELIWRTAKDGKNKKLNYYERIRVDTLNNEFVEVIEKIQSELRTIKEKSNYPTEDPIGDTKVIPTERRLINRILQLKSQSYSCKICLKYHNNMNKYQGGESYKRFMEKLKRHKLEFDIQKKVDAIFLKNNQKSYIVLLSKIPQETEEHYEFEFYGFQIENKEMCSLFEELTK